MTSLARAADLTAARPRGRVLAPLGAARVFLLWAAAGVAVALALTLALPLLFGGRPLTVMSGSMEPAIDTGDVVIAVPVAPLDTRPGDIVAFSDPNRGGLLVTHRVRSLRRDGSRVGFVTRGDANNAVEKWRIRADRRISRAVVRLPKLGRVLVFAKTPTGLLVLVLVPLLLLGALEIRSIWRDDEGAADDGP